MSIFENFDPPEATPTSRKGSKGPFLKFFHIPYILYLAYFFEIDHKKAFKKSQIKAKPISKYPQIRRDISIVVDSHIITSDLIDTVKKINPSIIRSVNVFDVYEGKNIEEGRKSIALGLILQEKSRTLTDDEADDIIKMTLKSLQSKYSAKLRE